MHQEALTPATRALFNELNGVARVKNFYLAGGSALALYYGHRFSVDLDWFSPDFSNDGSLAAELSKLGKFKIEFDNEHSLKGLLKEVSISFFRYPYGLIRPTTDVAENLRVASKEDIACMKLEAASRRGTKKDFIDLYFLLQEFSLEQMLGLMQEKYQGIEYNTAHLLRSLTYFEDAEGQVVQLIKTDITWAKVKEKITGVVREYLRRKI